jgi:hypothetical protein
MTTFEKNAWLWGEDPEHIYLPAQATQPFKAGTETGVVLRPSGFRRWEESPN